jgi:hypothetical protein
LRSVHLPVARIRHQKLTIALLSLLRVRVKRQIVLAASNFAGAEMSPRLGTDWRCTHVGARRRAFGAR